MKKLIFALLGLSLLFTSCSDVNIKLSLLYAERIDPNTAVIHNGAMKDTISLTKDDRLQSEFEKKLAKIEVGKGAVLIPEVRGYEVVGVREMYNKEEGVANGILFGIAIVITTIVLYNLIKTTYRVKKTE